MIEFAKVALAQWIEVSYGGLPEAKGHPSPSTASCVIPRLGLREL